MAFPASVSEQRLEPCLRVRGRRIQIDPRLGELAQPVVGAARELEHLHVLLEQPDCGQESLPLQSVLVELRGRHVGSGHQRHAAREQSRKQGA